MATYVVGDIQGCADSLRALLARCKLSKADRLWCVGDLVNRGPKSLEVLEFLMGLGARAQVVLGNHDLHLLACHAGLRLQRGDTLEPILSSPRCEELIDWLRSQPILFEEGGLAMVHAGINPDWPWAEVRRRAERIQERLRCAEGLEQLARSHPSQAAHSQAPHSQAPHSQASSSPWLEDLAWFTRVRFIREGKVDERYKGDPEEGGPQTRPWFELYERSLAQGDRPERLLVGHWAALGLKVTPHLVSLDTGCIWGRYLTAIRLDDGALFMQSTLERALTPKNQRGRD